jgi:hypothetical protein
MPGEATEAYEDGPPVRGAVRRGIEGNDDSDVQDKAPDAVDVRRIGRRTAQVRPAAELTSDLSYFPREES